MPTYILQGRYSTDAVRGMVNTPEDRAQAVAKLVEAVGGTLISYYVTFSDYDWLLVCETPGEQATAAAIVTALASGGVHDLKATVALTSAEATRAFEQAGQLTRSFRAAGAPPQ
jgi:uncharacterized protein with GYD domain